ncbi:hypothetical protein ACTFIZ_010985 [Dictyostelium cf. discoideum]
MYNVLIEYQHEFQIENEQLKLFSVFKRSPILYEYSIDNRIINKIEIDGYLDCKGVVENNLQLFIFLKRNDLFLKELEFIGSNGKERLVISKFMIKLFCFNLDLNSINYIFKVIVADSDKGSFNEELYFNFYRSIQISQFCFVSLQLGKIEITKLSFTILKNYFPLQSPYIKEKYQKFKDLVENYNKYDYLINRNSLTEIIHSIIRGLKFHEEYAYTNYKKREDFEIINQMYNVLIENQYEFQIENEQLKLFSVFKRSPHCEKFNVGFWEEIEEKKEITIFPLIPSFPQIPQKISHSAILYEYSIDNRGINKNIEKTIKTISLEFIQQSPFDGVVKHNLQLLILLLKRKDLFLKELEFIGSNGTERLYFSKFMIKWCCLNLELTSINYIFKAIQISRFCLVSLQLDKIEISKLSSAILKNYYPNCSSYFEEKLQKLQKFKNHVGNYNEYDYLTNRNSLTEILDRIVKQLKHDEYNYIYWYDSTVEPVSQIQNTSQLPLPQQKKKEKEKTIDNFKKRNN